MPPTPLDDFLFDLNGFLVLKQAASPELVAALNHSIDTLPLLEYGQWLGHAQRRDYNSATGLELHNCIELGGPFETLIDHPSWIEHVRRYCGEANSYIEGLFIDECILSVRRAGGHHPVHSGGYQGALRGAYHYSHGAFRCGQCNIILALTDIGPGDGATMVIPGSHKANLPHPHAGNYDKLERMDALEGAVEVHLQAGDALLFVDGLMHGGSSRTNTAGERRVTIYRYGPVWGASRFGYNYSAELLNRVTPAQRKILQPVEPVRPPA
ncbi:MAG: phytanoyl-CoA dioxygenase family protein [Anaerolineales bacterium]|nr:phytanoyl-CoA dioxygenase family protein [Anaerolineales bacterium]